MPTTARAAAIWTTLLVILRSSQLAMAMPPGRPSGTIQSTRPQPSTACAPSLVHWGWQRHRARLPRPPVLGESTHCAQGWCWSNIPNTSPSAPGVARPVAGHPRPRRDGTPAATSGHVGVRGVPAVARRCCMNTLCRWGGVARTSLDPPQEPHYGNEVEGSSHV